MDYQLIAVVCAGLGVVATILYFVVTFRWLRLLREIRDRLPERAPEDRQ